ncbi:MAG TPA: hypothetical protein VGL23_18640 [Chloroflexota bacterium]
MLHRPAAVGDRGRARGLAAAALQPRDGGELVRASPEFAIRVIQTLGDRLRANTELLAKVWH